MKNEVEKPPSFRAGSSHNGTITAGAFLNDRVTLHAGDCLDVLRGIPDATFDSVVTDPPYALVPIVKRFANSPRNEKTENVQNPYGRTGRGFMGKSWDNGERAFAVEFWAEVLRVLKPGGHVVAFSGTRTYHRMVVAIEDAGFEIRDQIGWVYGSGFPKSHDVSKAIDKAVGAERRVIAEGKAVKRMIPGADQHRDGWEKTGDRIFVPTETEAATAEAAAWAGWGTALKPSYEPLVLARKPWPHSTEWVTIASDLNRLEAQLWSMLSAKDVAVVLPSSQAASAEAMSASAAWLAESGSSIRADLSALMGMSQFVSATVSSLSTVSSWKDIWAALSDPESMSTIETASKTTTDWRTLKFSLSKITPATIIPAHNSGRWSNADACPAGRYFNATLSMFAATRERSALANAIDLWRRHSPAEDAPSPNWEPIVLARKPLAGTVAENVLAYGTGALNIGACRVGTDVLPAMTAGQAQMGTFERGVMVTPERLGRWPANIVHDGSDEVVSAFPDSDGQQGDVRGNEPSSPLGQNVYGDMNGRLPAAARGDTGSAARFFYSAKADAHDRIGSKHPTVKPVDLMQWLVRLVTPKRVLACPQCDSLAYGKSTENPSSDSPVPDVRDTVQAEGQRPHGQVLQPTVCGRGAASFSGELRVVRDDVSATEGRGAEVLRKGVRQPLNSEEPRHDEGVHNHEEGVCAHLDAGPPAGEGSERLHISASMGHAAGDREAADGIGGRASQERDKDGQPAGELGANAQAGPRQAEPATSEFDLLSSLPGDDCNKPSCPRCGTRLAYRPGRVLDPFAGTGTTGEAAWREGMRAVLVEREEEYRADIARRMRLADRPDERTAVAKAKGKTESADTLPLFGGGA